MSGDLVSALEQSELFEGFDRNQLSQVVTHLQPKPVWVANCNFARNKQKK